MIEGATNGIQIDNCHCFKHSFSGLLQVLCCRISCGGDHQYITTGFNILFFFFFKFASMFVYCF